MAETIMWISEVGLCVVAVVLLLCVLRAVFALSIWAGLLCTAVLVLTVTFAVSSAIVGAG